MAILWQPAPAPFIDANGNPYVGAKAYFFDANTTSPRTVYRDSGLGISHDHPVVANAAGIFPAVFLPSGDYRLRVTDAQGVTIWDVDGISAPTAGAATDPGAGSTNPTLLARTGDIKDRYDVGPHTGWVRCNGRTIGNATSGATERASADCEALFVFLWTIDGGLFVSGGRSATAAGDFAASKTILLPDFRLRVRAGLGRMGSDESPIMPGNFVDSGNNDLLGTTAGRSAIALTIDQMPAHDHGGETGQAGSHFHTYTAPGRRQFFNGTNLTDIDGQAETRNTSGVPDHAHSIPSAGGGQEHYNIQPTKLVTVYMKL